jgi:hypothetical protein
VMVPVTGTPGRNGVQPPWVSLDVTVVGAAMRRALTWLRSPTPTSPDPDAIVVVPLGGDAFRAETAAAACRAAGIRVELLVTEMGQHPASAGVQQQLLVRREDLDAVRAVLAATPPSPGAE